jgi:hypothetical protein
VRSLVLTTPGGLRLGDQPRPYAKIPARPPVGLKPLDLFALPLLRLIKACGSGHTGGDLSCIDIVNVLYNRIMRVSPETFNSPDRDYYVQSKGHCAEALFVVLVSCPLIK